MIDSERSRQTREGMARLKAEGMTFGRPDRQSEAMVRFILKQRKDGASFAAIADVLTEAGIPTSQGGKRWYPSTIQKICRGELAKRLAADDT